MISNLHKVSISHPSMSFSINGGLYAPLVSSVCHCLQKSQLAYTECLPSTFALDLFNLVIVNLVSILQTSIKYVVV